MHVLVLQSFQQPTFQEIANTSMIAQLHGLNSCRVLLVSSSESLQCKLLKRWLDHPMNSVLSPMRKDAPTPTPENQSFPRIAGPSFVHVLLRIDCMEF